MNTRDIISYIFYSLLVIIFFITYSQHYLAHYNNPMILDPISNNHTLPNVNLSISPEWLTAIGTIGSTIGAVGIAAYSFKVGRENEKNKD